MDNSQFEQTELVDILKELSHHIKLGIDKGGEKAPYSHYSDRYVSFYLDDIGYYDLYIKMFVILNNIEGISYLLSNDCISNNIGDILEKIADSKSRKETIDYKKTIGDLIKSLKSEISSYLCIIPIRGLSIDCDLQLGEIKFQNVENAKKLIEVNENDFSFFNKYSSHKDSFALCTVTAEKGKASEIAREKIESILNIIRFISSLIYFNQPHRHIALDGRNQNNFSYSLVLDESGNISQFVSHESTVLPLIINSEFMKYAKSHGFDFYIRGLNEGITQIEKTLYTAIQWFGDGLQDLIKINSFVKFYIAIETILKNEDENAKNVVPRRLSILLEPYEKDKQRKLESDIKDLIDERNSIFHSGVANKESPENLQYIGKIMGRNVIHYSRLKVESEKIKTKKDLHESLYRHYEKYLK